MKGILDPLPESLCFQSLADLLEVFKLLPEVVLDHAHCLDGPFPGGDEVRGREYRSLLKLLDVSPGDWVYHRQRVYLVAEEFDPQSFVRPSEEDIDCVPAYPEGATLEIDFRPGVIRVHKLVQQSCEAPLLTFFQGDRLGVEVLRVAYAVQQETLETTMTSLRPDISAEAALSLSLSIWSLMLRSFSM